MYVYPGTGCTRVPVYPSGFDDSYTVSVVMGFWLLFAGTPGVA